MIWALLIFCYYLHNASAKTMPPNASVQSPGGSLLIPIISPKEKSWKPLLTCSSFNIQNKLIKNKGVHKNTLGEFFESSNTKVQI